MADEENKQVTHRITDADQVTLYVFAGFFDALSCIPGLNVLISILGGGLMAFFFWLYGVSVFSQKIAVRYFGTLILEFIPFLSFVPGFLWITWMTITWSREEDKHQLLRMAEATVAATAFAKSKTPASDAKAVDRNVAALSKKSGRALGRSGFNEDGSKLNRYGDNVKNMDAGRAKIDPNQKGGLKAKDMTPSSISRRDLATSGLSPQSSSSGKPSVDGVVPPAANDNAPEEAAAAA